MFQYTVATLVLLLNASILFAQLTEFRAGDKLSASEMNKNFEYFKEKFQMRTTQVNCPNDSIQEALKEYNHIQISGECSENIFIELKGWNGPKILNSNFIYIEGTGSQRSTKILAKDTNSPTLFVNDSITVRVENITLENGNNVVEVGRNALFYGGEINIFNSDGSGINVYQGAYARVQNLNLDVTGRGLVSELSGTILIRDAVLENAFRAIYLRSNSHVRIFDLLIKNSQYPIDSEQSNTTSTNLNIESDSNIIGLRFYRSTGDFNNLNFNNAKIGMRQSNLNIFNSNITGQLNANREDLFTIGYNSSLMISDSTVRGYDSEAIVLYDNSYVLSRGTKFISDIQTLVIGPFASASLYDSEVSSTSEHAIDVSFNSGLRLNDTKIQSPSDTDITINGTSSVILSQSSSSLNEDVSISLNNNSYLSADGGVSLDSINCSSGSRVSLGSSTTIKNLDSDCTD